MRRIKPGFLSILLAAASLYAVGASAQWMGMSQDLGFYFGTTVGMSKAKNACENFSAGALVDTCDAESVASRPFLGYQLTENFAAEVGFSALGVARATRVFNGGPTIGAGVIKAHGPDLVLVAILPLGEDFSTYAKVGAFRWHVLASSNFGVGSRGVSASETDLTYGFGVKYKLTRQMSLLLEWQKYKHVGDPALTGRTDYDVYGIGVRYNP